MSLMEKFNNAVNKSKVKGANSEASFDIMYPTGFMALDYLNGQRIHVNSKDRHFSYASIGIVDGSTNVFISRSGVGKSTLNIQTAANIIKPFIRKGLDANIYIDDIEKSLNQARREFLLGLTNEEIQKHVSIRVDGITTESVLERITIIANEKLSNRDEYTYDTGKFDLYGNRIFKLVPTVYIIDSLSMLMPEDMQDKEDLGSNMSGATVAKQNSMLGKKITQLCTSANIIFFTVNHILDKINAGFMPEPAQIDGLKQNERIASAKVFLYLSNNIFRLDDKTTLKDSEGYGINGKVVDITLIKSRTNATRRSVPLIFDKTHGCFDNTLSLLHILKQEGKISGVGANCKLESCPDVRFSMKNFKDVLEESSDLQVAFAKECFELLSGLLADTKVEEYNDNSASSNIANLFDELGSNLE